MTLIYLGVGMLLVGIIYHLAFHGGTAASANDILFDGRADPRRNRVSASYTLIVAILLLAIGLFAVMNIDFHVGPFE